jgi:polyisoprenoid-binding protein YceI
MKVWRSMNTSTANSALEEGTWTLDPAATSIGFQATLLLGLKAKGHFDRYEATISVGASAAESSVRVTIYTDSVATGIKMRDGHLRADNVFDSARFPTMQFDSTTVAETPTGLDVAGELRVRDVTHHIKFHAVQVTTSPVPRYTVAVPITPKEFGITRPGTTKSLNVLIDATLRRS